MNYKAKMRKAMYRFYDLAERGLRHTPWGEEAARVVAHEYNANLWREVCDELDRKIEAGKVAAE